MIRTYSDKRIYKYFKIALGLSVVSLFIAVVSIVAHACATFLRVPKPSMDSTQIAEIVFFYLLMIMIPLVVLSCSAISLKPVKQNADKAIKETKWRNDVIRLLFPIIFSFAPYMALGGYFVGWIISLCFGHSDISSLAACARMCGYMLPSHVFAYFADVFLKNSGVLIQREWINDMPEFVKQKYAEKIKRREEKEKRQVEREKQREEMQTQRNETQCRALLQKCGMRFFIKYYRQIKTLPLRDVVLSETYSPEEKEERLSAAQKIINQNLSAVALETIIGEYGSSLESEEIEQAKELLTDIKPEDIPEPVEPHVAEQETESELYDPYDE